jgi:hypothetical protein
MGSTRYRSPYYTNVLLIKDAQDSTSLTGLTSHARAENLF